MDVIKKILVVDDDKAILEAVSLVLAEEGFQIYTNNSGIAIEKAIQKCKPDLLLLDLWLPTVDGNTITKRLKADPLTRSLPIILFSASGEVVKIAREAGADGCIVKPFNITDLVNLIRQNT